MLPLLKSNEESGHCSRHESRIFTTKIKYEAPIKKKKKKRLHFQLVPTLPNPYSNISLLRIVPIPTPGKQRLLFLFLMGKKRGTTVACL